MELLSASELGAYRARRELFSWHVHVHIFVQLNLVTVRTNQFLVLVLTNKLHGKNYDSWQQMFTSPYDYNRSRVRGAKSYSSIARFP